MASKTSIDEALEKHWSGLGLVARIDLIRALEIEPENKLLDGKSLDMLIQTDQDDLPPLVRGRLILALTKDGFSVEEYQRAKEGIFSSPGHEYGG